MNTLYNITSIISLISSSYVLGKKRIIVGMYFLQKPVENVAL